MVWKYHHFVDLCIVTKLFVKMTKVFSIFWILPNPSIQHTTWVLQLIKSDMLQAIWHIHCVKNRFKNFKMCKLDVSVGSSFIHLFIHSFIHLFIHLPFHPYILSFIHLFFHPFIHSFIYPFIHLSILLFIYLSFHLFTCPFIHSFIHLSIIYHFP